MRHLSGILIALLVLAFALPPMVSAIESLMTPAIILISLIGIGMFLFQRRRRW